MLCFYLFCLSRGANLKLGNIVQAMVTLLCNSGLSVAEGTKYNKMTSNSDIKSVKLCI